MFYNVTDYGVIADSALLQTEAVQKVFDMCAEGDTVVFPKGTYRIAGVYMHSYMTVLIKSGATIVGSEDCDEYVYRPVPEELVMRSDMELIPKYYDEKIFPERYRRSIISAYGCKSIAIIGEGRNSVIDGVNCFDPIGEENFRGPHGIYITNCEGVKLENYLIKDCGNFMHQIDNTQSLLLRNITALGGHDGVHLHWCKDVELDSCVFHTGDDCTAGIGMERVWIHNCDFNTSCNICRLGGSHVLFENCHMWGPGIYPHRMTIVKSRDNILPRTEGRHNCLAVFEFFSSEAIPVEEPIHDVVMKDCYVERIDALLHYSYGSHTLHTGTPLKEIKLVNCTFKDMGYPAEIVNAPGYEFELKEENVYADFVDGSVGSLMKK